MLSFNQLFYSENSSFDRLPLWRKKSKLIFTLTEDEEYDEDWWKYLNPEICTKTNLNIIWSLMTDYNFSMNFKNDAFISDFNNFEQIYRCADYLQIDVVCTKMCCIYLKSPYWGELTNAPEIMIHFIRSSQELLIEWSDLFINEQISGFWSGKIDTFEPRAWHPDLFYNTQPLCYYDLPDIGCTWWHKFWETLTKHDWNEERWQVMLPFLIKTNIFGLLAIFPLPITYCPVWSSTIALITGRKDNSIVPSEMFRPEWVSLLFQLSPTYFTLEWSNPTDNNRRKIYPLLIQFLACGMVNYVEDLLDVLPWNWGHDENKSILSIATSMTNSGAELLHRLYDKGFRPSCHIFDTLLIKGTVLKKFLTGWNYLLSQQDSRMPRMTQDTLTDWANTIVRLKKQARAFGNVNSILTQLKEICLGQIIKNVEDRQHYLKILSLGRKSWSIHDELTDKETDQLTSTQQKNLFDRNILWHIDYGDKAQNFTQLLWYGYNLDDLAYTHLTPH